MIKTIQKKDFGPAVEDVQARLALLGFLKEEECDGDFGPRTAEAVHAFCEAYRLDVTDQVDDKVWAALVDATFELGNRTLYLRMPHFHGHDVEQLQHALSALGFACGKIDGIFGANTEFALRKFQLNMGLPSDGIAGGYTYMAIQNLHHSWEGKEVVPNNAYLGFARAAEVLDRQAICLFGMDEFTKSVAQRMSNLAAATAPASKVISAEQLGVTPDENMYLVQIALAEHATPPSTPRVTYGSVETASLRIELALRRSKINTPHRIAIELPGTVWMDAKEERSAQHFAITLLDALCGALASLVEER